MKEAASKRRVELVASVLLPAFGVLVLVLEHFGMVDYWRGLDKVERVAERFDDRVNREILESKMASRIKTRNDSSHAS